MSSEIERLFEIVLHDGEGEFHALFLCGLARLETSSGERVAIRVVADEDLLATVLSVAQGREWILGAVSRACDGLKPPDDQPKDVQYRHFSFGGNPPDAA